MSKGDLSIDPRGLIFEAYRMEIGPGECRTIFLDWAIGLPEGAAPEHLRTLLAHYGAANPEHPMTAVLREGLVRADAAPRRRGGWRAKRPD